MNEVDRRAHFLEAHVRVLLAQSFDRGSRSVRDVQRARTPRSDYLEPDDLLAVQQRQLAALRGLIANLGNRVEAERPAVRQHDRQGGELLRRGDRAGRAHALFEAADASFTARILGLDSPQLT